MCVSYLILYLRCKFSNNIPNDCEDFGHLPFQYFILGHPVVVRDKRHCKVVSTVSDMKRMI